VDPKMFYYRFPTLAMSLEEMTPYRVLPGRGIVGIRIDDLLGLAMGIGAKRHYPYGYFLILPQPTGPSGIPAEVPQDYDMPGPSFY